MMSREARAGWPVAFGAWWLAAGCNALLGYEEGAPRGTTAGNASTTTTTTNGGQGGAGAATASGVPGGQGGSAGSSGGGGAGGSGGASPCPPALIADDFDADTINGAKWGQWTTGAASVGLANGRVFVAPHDPSTGASYAALYGNDRYDLRGCSIWLEVAEIFHATLPAETYFALKYDADNLAWFTISNNGLSFELEIDAVITAESSVAYDPAQHRWLRFREESGTLLWETSPDAVTWTERFLQASPPFLSSVEMTFGGGVWAASSSQGRAEFDNANVVP